MLTNRIYTLLKTAPRIKFIWSPNNFENAAPLVISRPKVQVASSAPKAKGGKGGGGQSVGKAQKVS